MDRSRLVGVVDSCRLVAFICSASAIPVVSVWPISRFGIIASLGVAIAITVVGVAITISSVEIIIVVVIVVLPILAPVAVWTSIIVGTAVVGGLTSSEEER